MFFSNVPKCNARPNGSAVLGVGLRPLACWDCGFEFHQGHERLSVVNDVCVCALSGRGLCNELITRPEESYRLWGVNVCDLETSWMRRPWPMRGCCAKNKQTNKPKCNIHDGPQDHSLSRDSRSSNVWKTFPLINSHYVPEEDMRKSNSVWRNVYRLRKPKTFDFLACKITLFYSHKRKII